MGSLCRCSSLVTTETPFSTTHVYQQGRQSIGVQRIERTENFEYLLLFLLLQNYNSWSILLTFMSAYQDPGWIRRSLRDPVEKKERTCYTSSARELELQSEKRCSHNQKRNARRSISCNRKPLRLVLLWNKKNRLYASSMEKRHLLILSSFRYFCVPPASTHEFMHVSLLIESVVWEKRNSNDSCCLKERNESCYRCTFQSPVNRKKDDIFQEEDSRIIIPVIS